VAPGDRSGLVATQAVAYAKLTKAITPQTPASNRIASPRKLPLISSQHEPKVSSFPKMVSTGVDTIFIYGIIGSEAKTGGKDANFLSCVVD